MARFATPVALIAIAVALATAPSAASAQRPALTGEKARVAEAVKRDLIRLSTLQRTYHERSKLYAADARELNFTSSSGAEISIAFASVTAWAANASHSTLSPVKCFIIISAADAPEAPTSQPFCTDADPGTAAGRVAMTSAAAAPATPPASPEPKVAEPVAAAAKPPAATPSSSRPPAAPPRTSTPARAATPVVRDQGVAPAGVAAAGGAARAVPGSARLSTREVIAGASSSDKGESVSVAQFAQVLADFAQSALAVLNSPAPELVRDPYESTPEWEQRRAIALAEYERREAEFFRANTRTYSVQLTVRNVKYDPDREVVEFSIDPVKLPVLNGGGSGAQLSLTCYTRPVFWCSPETGMTYDAGDLWRVPRAIARQHDVLRTPMVLVARYTVGRLEGERSLAISLVDMDLQARGQSVQRWPSR